MSQSRTDAVHFLLVDDLEENLLALEAVLRRDNLVLLKARSGEEALEILLRHEVGLALIDVRMPGMDGFELAEIMRGSERTRRVPIIFLTAGASDWQRRFRGYEAGAVDFLGKPIEEHILRSKAEVFFELQRQRQELTRQRDELKAATEENARLLRESRQYLEALRDVDRRKDEFLATLAHELRNPLAPLRTGLQILKLRPHEDEAAHARDMMDRQLAHMVRLIDDLLDVSRVSSGKLVLKPEEVTVQSIVYNAIESCRPLIESSRHVLTVQCPQEPIRLQADPVRLTQVLSNLLNNAAKYTPEKGCIQVSARQEGQEVVLAVTDTGIGINATMLPRVFEMFTQVEPTFERTQGGLGIGLALVKRLVEMHRGTISAESPGPGQGSTFTVRVPLTQDEMEPSPDSSSPPPAVENVHRSVLIVDDNVDAADSFAMLLKLLGHQVRVAHHGRDALAQAREFHPEVVFLDIGLPEISGYDIARQLRKDPALKSSVLVAVTGWGSDEDRRKSNEAGFDHHFVKPIDPMAIHDLLTTTFATTG